MFPSILIVDDEPSILQSLHGLLCDEGFEVGTASNGYAALKTIDRESPDLVLLDIWMPGIDGIETLREIKKNNPLTQVIIITGHGNVETAVRATKLGAFDLIEKPLSIDKIIVTINNALNFRRLEEENRYLRKKTIEKNSITGDSPPIRALKKQIAVAAPTEAWVLISGENGTGKELVARTIHQLSSRVDQPLIDVNCAALGEELFETEMFGCEKGAVAGASAKTRGRLELASGGTLFFDEIGDMDLKLQAKILRVLQEQKFQRVGGSRILSMDVRVIAATNKDLEIEIDKGRFREDLYYRLNIIPIEVPPLRARVADIPLLVETFLALSAEKAPGNRKKVAPAALDLLCAYAWPGNVRELKNLMERLTIMVEKEEIEAADLPAPYNPAASKSMAAEINPLMRLDHYKDAQKAFEKEFIRRKLSEYGFDIEKTAAAIGLAPSSLQKKTRSWKLMEK